MLQCSQRGKAYVSDFKNKFLFAEGDGCVPILIVGNRIGDGNTLYSSGHLVGTQSGQDALGQLAVALTSYIVYTVNRAACYITLSFCHNKLQYSFMCSFCNLTCNFHIYTISLDKNYKCFSIKTHKIKQ